MNNSLQRLNLSIQNLEEIVAKRLSSASDPNDSSAQLKQLIAENITLKEELDKTKQEYQLLQDSSKDVINELNNSIQIIEDYFKKQN